MFLLPFYNRFYAPSRVPIPEDKRKPGGPVDRPFTLADLTDVEVILWIQFKLIDEGGKSGKNGEAEPHRREGHLGDANAGRKSFGTGQAQPLQHQTRPGHSKSLGKRLQAVNNSQTPRTALEPKFFAGILKRLLFHVDRFGTCFGLNDYREYKPQQFEFGEFELVLRNMMAVMIGYMFGLRASTLFNLKLDDIKIIEPDTPGGGPHPLVEETDLQELFANRVLRAPRVGARTVQRHHGRALGRVPHHEALHVLVQND